LLAENRDERCKASLETIEQALTGNYRPEHQSSRWASHGTLATAKRNGRRS
jgi:hypothetical protein